MSDMKIAIYGSRRQFSIVDIIERFLGILRNRGVEVMMHGKLYDHLHELIPAALDGLVAPVEGSDFTADLALSLGGDGTFLRTAVWVGDKQIPIIGVNTGHLGYLSALSIHELPQLLDFIADDRLRIERRSMLCVTDPELPDGFSPVALNEVAIAKDQHASMINADVSVGYSPLAEYRADGLILCTSTGSTAYNLSVGGPIVDPTLDVWVLSPVAAHSLAMRPLVIGSDQPVTIVPTGRASRVRLALDGRSLDLPMGTPVTICKAPYKVMVMQLAGHTFADTLRTKLHWGEQ